MARWTGTWLTGLGSAGVEVGREDRGARLGLPVSGPGSVASFSSRAGAYLLDAVIAGVLGAVVSSLLPAPSPTVRQVVAASVFAVLTIAGLALSGQTPGMRATGVRVRLVREDGPALPFVPAALRTALLLTFILAVVVDRDGRGLHDRAAGTVVVRT